MSSSMPNESKKFGYEAPTMNFTVNAATFHSLAIKPCSSDCTSLVFSALPYVSFFFSTSFAMFLNMSVNMFMH